MAPGSKRGLITEVHFPESVREQVARWGLDEDAIPYPEQVRPLTIRWRGETLLPDCLDIIHNLGATASNSSEHRSPSRKDVRAGISASLIRRWPGRVVSASSVPGPKKLKASSSCACSVKGGGPYIFSCPNRPGQVFC